MWHLSELNGLKGACDSKIVKDHCSILCWEVGARAQFPRQKWGISILSASYGSLQRQLKEMEGGRGTGRRERGAQGASRRGAPSSLVLHFLSSWYPFFVYSTSWQLQDSESSSVWINWVSAIHQALHQVLSLHHLIPFLYWPSRAQNWVSHLPSSWPISIIGLCQAPFQFILFFLFISHLYSHFPSLLEAPALVYLINALPIHALYVYLDIFIHSTNVQCRLCVRQL